jgi:hypothetical protein
MDITDSMARFPLLSLWYLLALGLRTIHYTAMAIYYMVTDGIWIACIPSVHLPTEISDSTAWVSRQPFDGQQVYMAGVIIHT